jgi:tetratricopeptide (TPR) repeat protein
MNEINDLNPIEKLEYYEKQLKIAKDAGDVSKILSLLLKLGIICHDVEALDLGINYIKEALTLGKKSLVNGFSYYAVLGDLYHKNGSLKESYDAYMKSNKFIPKNQETELKAANFFKMGRLNALLEKYNDAIKNYKESLKLYDILNNNAERARVNNQIGVTHLKKAPLDLRRDRNIYNLVDKQALAIFRKARKNFTKGIEILEQHNLKDHERQLYNTLQANLKPLKQPPKFPDYKLH